MNMKTITTETFTKLDEALRERLAIKQAEAQLQERKDKNTAILLELGSPLVNEDERTVAAGFIISENTEVTIGDTNAAMAWVKANPFIGGQAVQLRKEAIATVWGFTLQLEKLEQTLTALHEKADTETKAVTEPLLNTLKAVNLSNAFELYETGYKGLVRSGTYNDIPHTSTQKVNQVRITEKSVKLGDELKAQFEVKDANQTVS